MRTHRYAAATLAAALLVTGCTPSVDPNATPPEESRETTSNPAMPSPTVVQGNTAQPSPTASDPQAGLTDQLGAELSALLETAGYAPLGGDHDFGYATESFEVALEGRTTVLISVSYGADNVAEDLIGQFETSETRDGGGATVMLGSWPQDAPGAVVTCPDRTLTLRTAEQTMEGSAVSREERTAGASRAAEQLVAAGHCAGLDG